jgi:hypothetical protein
MKPILLLISLLSILTCSSQSVLQRPSALLIHSDHYSALTAVDQLCSDQKFHHYNIDEDAQCNKYHSMKIAGISLTAGGGGLILASLGLFAAAIGTAGGEHTGAAQPGENHSGTNGLLISAIACGGTGVACFFTGLPLLKIGVSGCRRNCARSRSHMELRSAGNNLALSF